MLSPRYPGAGCAPRGDCFAPGTLVDTSAGSLAIDDLFARGDLLDSGRESVAVRPGVTIHTHRGHERAVRGVFRRHYAGAMMIITPRNGQPIHVTPDHEFLALARAARGTPPPYFFMPASGITPEFDLLEPRRDGSFRRRALEETRVIAYDGPVFDLEVEEDRTYLVQGLAVHDATKPTVSRVLAPRS